MKKTALIILFLVSQAGFACDCDWIGDFFEASKKMDLVIKVQVISKIADEEGFNEKMTVEIIDRFRGEETKNIITVWGDGGADCRPYIDYFDIGDICYLALSKYGQEYEQINCGELFLKVISGKVIGNEGVRSELPQISRMTEIDFLARLKKQ